VRSSKIKGKSKKFIILVKLKKLIIKLTSSSVPLQREEYKQVGLPRDDETLEEY
jgi:hypothetical protein